MTTNNVRIEIEDSVLTRILENAEKAYPSECCGVLLGSADGTVADIWEARNAVSEEKRGVCFSIDPLELYRCETESEERGVRIVGFYHSHPDAPARLSGDDLKGMIPDMTYLVVSAVKGTIKDVKAYKKKRDQRGMTTF